MCDKVFVIHKIKNRSWLLFHSMSSRSVTTLTWWIEQFLFLSKCLNMTCWCELERHYQSLIKYRNWLKVLDFVLFRNLSQRCVTVVTLDIHLLPLKISKHRYTGILHMHWSGTIPLSWPRLISTPKLFWVGYYQV